VAREAILANFKKFTATDGRTVWANVDDISLAEPFKDYVRVTFNNGEQVELKDDVRSIIGGEEKPSSPANFNKPIDYPKSSPA
jgi:hypothetical protein